MYSHHASAPCTVVLSCVRLFVGAACVPLCDMAMIGVPMKRRPGGAAWCAGVKWGLKGRRKVEAYGAADGASLGHFTLHRNAAFRAIALAYPLPLAYRALKQRTGDEMDRAIIAVLIALLVTSCAKDANQVSATYISPVAYESYTCQQLAEEAQRVQARAAQAAGVQDQHATNDKVVMGVGLVIFWPALFFTKGNDENTAELSRLKGEMDAVEEASIEKKCAITFQHGGVTASHK